MKPFFVVTLTLTLTASALAFATPASPLSIRKEGRNTIATISDTHAGASFGLFELLEKAGFGVKTNGTTGGLMISAKNISVVKGDRPLPHATAFLTAEPQVSSLKVVATTTVDLLTIGGQLAETLFDAAAKVHKDTPGNQSGRNLEKYVHGSLSCQKARTQGSEPTCSIRVSKILPR